MIAGILNSVDEKFNGLSLSVIYQHAANFNGLCISTINIANKGKALQGLQIGLININRHKEHFKILPFINFSFRKLED